MAQKWWIYRRVAVTIVLLLLGLCFHTTFNPTSRPRPGTKLTPASTPHPIDTLIEQGDTEFESLLAKETEGLASAADAYRQARGRHPPPGFEQWYRFAKEKNAIMIENFWDQIYHDLAPFWAVPAAQIRADARAYDMVVNVRNGRAQANTGWFWHETWANMVNTVSDYLPDMVLPANSMGTSSRLFYHHSG